MLKIKYLEKFGVSLNSGKSQIFYSGILFCFAFLSCNYSEKDSTRVKSAVQERELSYTDSLKQLFEQNPNFIAKGFDFPVGKPDAAKYYNAQPFGENNHLGDDWNGVGGGNSDMGDPVFSIGNGWVSEASDFGGGWGKVVRVVHYWEKQGRYEFVESFYAHLEKIQIEKGHFIKKGQQLGTIGNANGVYVAHLHFEIREDIEMEIGGGYSLNTQGYLNPTEFIQNNR